jgi:hypothetical protein
MIQTTKLLGRSDAINVALNEMSADAAVSA